MALDFPTSPSNGQKYPQPAVVGQPVYTWDGEKWSAASSGASPTILVSDSPPTNPPDNALWWESDSGLLYLRYSDGDTSQWVIAAPQPDVSVFAGVAYVDAADAALQAADAALTTSVNGKVAKAGDTMTGGLFLAFSNPWIVLQKPASGQSADIFGTATTGDLVRWRLALGDNTAESGSHSGSNFTISRFADDGAALLGTPLQINRATGKITVEGDPTAALGVATKQYIDNKAASSAEFLANTAGKFLTVEAVWGGAVNYGLSDASGTITPDLSLGSDFYVLLTGTGRTFANPLNPKLGQKGIIDLNQDGTGGRTITTWGSSYKFPGGTKPSLTTTGGMHDAISYWVLSTTFILCTFSADFK